ncbi:hypothetical protein BC834DRAFT_921341 [Gloeopeniophorella convolvens]|nr:hypothetical protein BC834DRAFT_921341 [Gloeopeniophorella convolvens]
MGRKPRTIVLCFDGTTNEYGPNNTNVVKLYSLLRKDKVEDQLCYYQAGIGTYFQPGVVSPLFNWAAQLLDEAIAWYLYEHVMDGYKFLMQNYNVGDKVCLFGFSRGAYTARALAGMLHKVGLLSKDNLEQVPFAYNLYKSTKASDIALVEGFKASFSREVPIEFVGVWDTVASVGVVMGPTLPFVDVNTTIRVFRQALSLDEHRAKFRPNLYHRSTLTNQQPTSLRQRVISRVRKQEKDSEQYQKVKDNLNGQAPTTQAATDEIYNTDVKEVWFAGCHSDVGGGVALDTAPSALANIPLRWMIQEVMLNECGVLFDMEAFARWNIPLTIGQPFESNPPPDGDAPPVDDPQEAQDVVQPIDDELKKTPVWWLLEIVPTSYTYQNTQDKWITKWSFHLGRGRWVPPSPLFHESVKIRMDDAKLKYKPRAKYAKDTETYVS